MTTTVSTRGLTRRQLLKSSAAAGAIAVVGAGFIASPNAAWALEVSQITEHEMATLMQMARDIFPHDQVGDKFYAIAVKGYDTAEQKEFVAQGVAKLDELARAAGAPDYLETKWEDNRVALLKQIEDDAFFQTVRGGLVTGLYNQKAVWPIFGYEGESFSQGGYIDRGFNDINWL
ncbi:twin-arginine translocation signal domain-containing protein [Ruegeria hyattellae]|uniref:twin-arginine translocation signal domain-containing protein n=1 Tax=Ruegeria hyattellae TaxID=3233337 RepID=UPI00355B826F